MQHDRDWHSLAPKEVLADMQSFEEEGLTQEEVDKRLEEYGLNQLPQPPKRGFLVRFFSHFHNILIYVLIGAAVVTALLDHMIDTAVIVAVVIINAIIGYIQEGKAEKAMDAIRHMLALRSSVIRNGSRHTVEGDKLVPGDIVLLQSGDKVPADIRLLDTHGLQIQEAILTGESVAVEKHPSEVKSDAPLGDRTSMAYSGTTVTRGQGKGVVVSTGGHTQIGRISGMLSEVATITTPLVEQMGVFSKWLTLFILGVAAAIVGFGYIFSDMAFAELFMAAVGMLVAAIPEGLPAVMTITLAVGVQSMAKRNAIIRRLPAIETLGSVSVICSDKTGTLTRNEMNVATIATRDKVFDVEGNGYEPVGDIKVEGSPINPTEFETLQILANASILCNDAQLENNQGTYTVEGDPMEGALLAFASKASQDIQGTRSRHKRTDIIPFDSEHKFMATLNHDHEGAAFIVVKGAPERIIDMCSLEHSNSSEKTVDKTYWQEKAEEIAQKGERVLGIAYKTVDPSKVELEHDDIKEELVLLGLIGLIDPPRTEAIEAVKECQEAGIEVKMITGDHAATAKAIGEQLGLKNAHTALTGAELDTISDEKLKEVVLTTGIFARTTPEHKLRLVMALQSHDMTVAMTGDGVNDTPALKRADAGVAMGQTGSEAAKEASEVVLADDNFASIASAVREGRTVYDNIKKVISWTLPTNASEALTILLALALGMALPITPVQILWVNMITAVTLGIALAFEPTQPDTMKRKPRSRKEPILNGELVYSIGVISVLFLVGVFGMFFFAIEVEGYDLAHAQTITMNTLVMLEIVYLFFIRNMRTPHIDFSALKATKPVWISVGIVVAGQALITYTPFFQKVFGTHSVALHDVAIIFVVGLVMFGLMELEKQVRFRLFKDK